LFKQLVRAPFLPTLSTPIAQAYTAPGGVLISSADTKDEENTGKGIIVGGLFLQIVFFSLFISVTGIFHRRILSRPTSESQNLPVPWRRYILVLYAVSALITVRSVFRVIEFIQGPRGTLMTNEVYMYVFDAVLMFLVSLVFNIYHPRTIITRVDKGAVMHLETGTMGGTYDSV
jgi:hypothetical protein